MSTPYRPGSSCRATPAPKGTSGALRARAGPLPRRSPGPQHPGPASLRWQWPGNSPRLSDTHQRRAARCSRWDLTQICEGKASVTKPVLSCICSKLSSNTAGPEMPSLPERIPLWELASSLQTESHHIKATEPGNWICSPPAVNRRSRPQV